VPHPIEAVSQTGQDQHIGPAKQPFVLERTWQLAVAEHLAGIAIEGAGKINRSDRLREFGPAAQSLMRIVKIAIDDQDALSTRDL
jgi:hypothetical protein